MLLGVLETEYIGKKVLRKFGVHILYCRNILEELNIHRNAVTETGYNKEHTHFFVPHTKYFIHYKDGTDFWFSSLIVVMTSECRNSRNDRHEQGSARLPWNVTILNRMALSVGQFVCVLKKNAVSRNWNAYPQLNFRKHTPCITHYFYFPCLIHTGCKFPEHNLWFLNFTSSGSHEWGLSPRVKKKEAHIQTYTRIDNSFT